MKENTARRVVFRLVTLCVLLGGLLLVAAERPEYSASANNCDACHNSFPGCNATCSPSNAVPCYGNCQSSYASCLWGCGDQYSRTPLIDPSQSCWENAESVYNHCLVGQMPGQSTYTPDYAGVYASCMAANNDDIYVCCDEVRYSWWDMNGPWCY